MRLLPLRPLTFLTSALSFRVHSSTSFLFPLTSIAKQPKSVHTKTSTSTIMSASKLSSWEPKNPDHVEDARSKLNVWPLDEYNAVLLDEVHPRDYLTSAEKPHEIYDLIAIGAGAGGLVSSKQSARRGAKSCMISEHLAGGDCLNVGSVPSKGMSVEAYR